MFPLMTIMLQYSRYFDVGHGQSWLLIVNSTEGHPPRLCVCAQLTWIKLILPALYSSSWQSRFIIKRVRWPLSFSEIKRCNSIPIVVAMISEANLEHCIIHYIALFASNTIIWVIYIYNSLVALCIKYIQIAWINRNPCVIRKIIILL